MTQMQRAFYAAVENSIRANFTNILGKTLRDKAEENFNQSLNKFPLPEINARTLPALTPETQLWNFVQSLESTLEELSQNAKLNALIQMRSTNVNKIAEKVLFKMNSVSFRDLRNEIIANWLVDKGLPSSVCAVGLRLFKLLSAAKLFQKLNEANRKNTDENFNTLAQRLNKEAGREAFLAMAEYSRAEITMTAARLLMREFVVILNRLRQNENGKELLADEWNIVVNAFAPKR